MVPLNLTRVTIHWDEQWNEMHGVGDQVLPLKMTTDTVFHGEAG